LKNKSIKKKEIKSVLKFLIINNLEVKIEDEIKGRFRNNYHKGIINLKYTVNHLSYQFLQFLKKHDLTEQQYNILRVLRGFRKEGPKSIGFLKERMLNKSSDVSRILDKLFDKALISRKEGAVDRRQKDVAITEKGLKLLSEMYEIENQVDTFLKNLTENEVIELNRLLDKIRE